ncbi:MAG: SGNH/GDSL hydrolase family protein [Actinomycetales bacterium]|nr:MAG: SGNH/GDSL hydrolase family protein [Actinomycetales bacterium]
MPVPLEHPIRVVVKGSSLVVMVPDRNGEPGEYTFPRWIQNGLLDRGRPCEVVNRGVAGELTRSAFDTWESQVMADCPDVVVYGYAYYECIHSLLPHWLERHVNTYNGRTGPLRTRYRGYLLRPLWKLLAQTQRVLDGRIGARFFGRRTHRIVRDYELLIKRTRTLAAGSPRVFVLALLGPGGKAPEWFPGMQARIDAMNVALAAMVEGFDDPMVTLVPVGELAAGLPDGADPVPDGMHYSPHMRRLIGDWIAGEIDTTLPPVA